MCWIFNIHNSHHHLADALPLLYLDDGVENVENLYRSSPFTIDFNGLQLTCTPDDDAKFVLYVCTQIDQQGYQKDERGRQ